MYNGAQFTLNHNISGLGHTKIVASQGFTMYVAAENSFQFLVFTQAGGIITNQFTDTATQNIDGVAIDGGAQFFAFIADTQLNVYYQQQCLPECMNCSFPNYCSVCLQNYYVYNGACLPTVANATNATNST